MPKTLVTATVDRLLRRAHIRQTTGDSVRLPSTRRPGSETVEHLTNHTGQWPPRADPWPPPCTSRDHLPVVKDLHPLELDQPAEDARSYVTGPAVILDAIAIYRPRTARACGVPRHAAQLTPPRLE